MSHCRNFKKILSGQDGIGVLSLVLVIPVVLGVIAFFLHRWGELRDSKVLRAECRDVLGQGQTQAGYRIQSLLDLNPQVKLFKAEMAAAIVAKTAAVATANGPALAQAERWIVTTRQRQIATRQAQRLMIILGETELNAASYRAETNLRLAPQKIGLSARKITDVRIERPGLAVRKTDADAEYPEYELQPEFESRQKLELTWQSHYRTRREENAWSPRNAKISESCGMTLTPETRSGRGFSARPSQAKYFWKR